MKWVKVVKPLLSAKLPASGFSTIFDQYFQISRGALLPNFTAIGSSGVVRNIDIEATPQDVWGGGGLFPYLTVATPLEAVSSSANDTAAGTGARTAVVSGLDANWNSVNAVITLNGAGASAPTVPLLRVNAFRALSCGSVGTNAGDVTLRAVGGATQAFMRTGDGQCLRSVISVPAGFTAMLLDAFVAIIRPGGNEYAEIQIKARTLPGPWITRNVFSVHSGGLSTFNISPRIIGSLPEKSDLRFTVTQVSADDTDVNATMILVLAKVT